MYLIDILQQVEFGTLVLPSNEPSCLSMISIAPTAKLSNPTCCGRETDSESPQFLSDSKRPWPWAVLVMHMHLPLYTSSSPAPSYAPDPSADEERLEITYPLRPNGTRTGKFTKEAGKITIFLYEQDNGVQVPVYERNSIVSGTICLEDCANASTVILKVGIFFSGSKCTSFTFSSRL